MYQTFESTRLQLLDSDRKYEESISTNRRQNREFEVKINDVITKCTKLSSEVLSWKEKYANLESELQFTSRKSSTETIKELDSLKAKVLLFS